MGTSHLLNKDILAFVVLAEEVVLMVGAFCFEKPDVGIKLRAKWV